MKSFYLKVSILTIAIIGISIYSINSKVNGLAYPYTGAPSESNCTSCHATYTLQTSGTNYNKISFSGNFTGSGYIPDSTYTITVTYKETGKKIFGFQMTALQDMSGSYPTPAGTFASKDSRTSAFNFTLGSSKRYYIEHTSTGANAVATDSVSYVFSWKAPSTNMGNIRFHLIFNSTNANNNDNGDYIYSKSFVVSPSTLLPVAKAKLTDTLACSGSSLSFNGTSTNNATSYSWSFPGGSPTTSTAQNPSVSYGTTGTKMAILQSTNSKGKSLLDTLYVNVVQGASLPALVPNTTPTNLCTGDSFQLKINNFSSGNSYVWSPSGKTSSAIIIKTAGNYSVTSKNNTTGCTRTSSIIKVIAQTKPIVGLQAAVDSICSNASITLKTKNANGYCDSYSMFKTGPYFKDSNFQNSINSGKNAFSFYAKSTNGCISNPISKNIIGVDTFSAPTVSVLNKTTNSITFGWSSVPYTTSYLISLDSGKTWKNPTLGKLSTQENVSLSSFGSKKTMLVKAIINNYCGVSKTGSVVGQGLGCSDVNYTINIPKLKICKNEVLKCSINGLYLYSKYSILMDGNALKDTQFSITGKTSKSYSIQVLDSNNIICGYTTKQFTVTVDSAAIPLISNLSNPVIFCDGIGTKTISPKISNYNTGDSILTVINKKISFGTKSSGFNLQVQTGDSVSFWTKTQSGCIAKSSIYPIVGRKPLDPKFTKSYVKDTIYKFNPNDTTFIHFWNIGSDTSSLVHPIKNLASYANQTVQVIHTIHYPKKYSVCSYSDTQKILINQFAGIKDQKLNISIYPNPVKVGSILKIGQKCESIQLFDNLGRLKLNLANSDELYLDRTLSAGIYRLQLIKNKSIQTINLEVLD